MSDDDLKLRLVAMLPDHIVMSPVRNRAGANFQTFWWAPGGRQLGEDSWLHVCWLAERAMDPVEFERYRHILSDVVFDEYITKHNRNLQSASWQQRAEALCKVRG